jgi:hypothetical protein
MRHQHTCTACPCRGWSSAAHRTRQTPALAGGIAGGRRCATHGAGHSGPPGSESIPSSGSTSPIRPRPIANSGRNCSRVGWLAIAQACRFRTSGVWGAPPCRPAALHACGAASTRAPMHACRDGSPAPCRPLWALAGHFRGHGHPCPRIRGHPSPRGPEGRRARWPRCWRGAAPGANRAGWSPRPCNHGGYEGPGRNTPGPGRAGRRGVLPLGLSLYNK